MLLGAVINIHTDHKNILHLGDSSQRRLQWISYVDEYGPKLHYIKGPSNVIADMFSRMPMQDTAPLAMVGKDESKIDPFNCHFLFTDDREKHEVFRALTGRGMLPQPSARFSDQQSTRHGCIQRAARCWQWVTESSRKICWLLYTQKR